MNTICGYCGKEFKKSGKKVYCDKICKYHYAMYIRNSSNTVRKMKKCYTCEKDFFGPKKIIFCSEDCKIPKRERYKMESSSMKDELINMKGGKCSHCEKTYERTAMCFHHLKGVDKKFTIDQKQILVRSKEEILKELEKCILLCHNCHGILHEKEREISVKKWHINEQNKRVKKIQKKRMLIDLAGGKCVCCGYKCGEFIQIMSFDHLRDKKFVINSSTMYGKTDDELLNELLKCELLCMNCHISKNDKENRQKSINSNN